jgi:hypothetical protein
VGRGCSVVGECSRTTRASWSVTVDITASEYFESQLKILGVA